MNSNICDRCSKETSQEDARPRWFSSQLTAENKFWIYASFNVTAAPGNPEPLICLKCRHELIEKALTHLRGEAFSDGLDWD